MNIALGLILVFMVVWVLIIGETIILPFMIALFLPDATMVAILPGETLNSSAEFAYFFIITPACI